ncbi:hypothetical protein GCM10018963_30620 [Saccharothrix longispora]
MAERMDYISMSIGCDRVRSHGWWRNVVVFGAWSGPGESRVAPPPPEAMTGIAKLFGTTEEHVKAMVAEDWYGVAPASGPSGRVQRLALLIDRLSEPDADLVESILRRIAPEA